MTYPSYNQKDWGPFRPGSHYEVIHEFVDEQGINHPVGESWEYLGCDYFPYDNGLTLYVKSSGQEIKIRLELKEGLQKEIDNNWSLYVKETNRC